MKKKNIFLLFIEIFILIFIIMFKTIILDNNISIMNIVNISFWIILSIIIYVRYHYPRNKNYLKADSIRVITICILSYILITYLSGIIVGFDKNVFSLNPIAIIKNILPVLIVILAQEYIRYIVACNSKEEKKYLIILTLLYIILDIIMQINNYSFSNFESIIGFVSTVVFISIAKEILFSYITYEVGCTPTTYLKSVLELYVFIVPIFPSLGDFLYSSIMLIFFFIIYISLSTNINYVNKENKYIRNLGIGIVLVPFLGFLIVLMTLISGIFGFQLVTIGSNSMKGEYQRGDAIIYKKVSQLELNEIKEGMILVFQREDIVITHRITKIEEINNVIWYTTKGDANEEIDSFKTEGKDVLGYVTYKIPYIGYPTILLSEAFK